MHTKSQLIIILFTVMLHLHLGAQEQPTFPQLWKQALKAANDGLPQSALETATLIRAKAISEHNHIELIRSALFQFGQMASFEENHLTKSIRLAENQLALLDKPSEALMHSLIAEMYWFYYQQNRYRVLERQAVEAKQAPPAELSEWAAADFRNVILGHYEQSLAAQSAMDTIPLQRWQDILESVDKESFAYYPSLFDFVANRALNFYRSQDAALTPVLSEKPQLPPTVWAPLTDFVASKLPSSLSAALQELRLIQKLLLSNLRGDNVNALVWNDIQRLNFLKNYFTEGSKTDSTYLLALRELQESYAWHEASAEVAAARAAFFVETKHAGLNPLSQALKICDEAIAAWPNSKGAVQCRQIRQNILAKELAITAQRVVLPAQAIALRLSYRNITEPAIRIIPISSTTLTKLMELPDEKMQLKAFAALPPMIEKTLSLPFENDYRQHSAIVDIAPLPAGLYLILASDRKQFDENGITSFAMFQASRLSFIGRKEGSNNLFFLLDRDSGKPITKAKVRIMGREYDYGNRKYNTIEKKLLITNSKGAFSFGPNEINDQRQAYYIEAYYGNDTLFSDNYFDVNPITQPTREQLSSWFFTDRSIYRPGQTVFFKGITLKRAGNDPWETLNNAQTKIRLFDANGKEIAQIERTSNTYGSFEGSFTIPQNQMPGNWRIGNEHGVANIEVDFYKRPTFELKLKTTEQQFKLGENVSVEGNAQALAGYSLDSAKVNYRVFRTLIMPYRGYWWFPPQPQEKVLVAEGKIQTNKKGHFVIRFDALAGPKQNLPFHLYNFEVIADVTDRNGETQSANFNLSIGDQALFFETSLEEISETAEIGKQEIALYNAQHQSIDAEVSYRISLLEPNKRLIRNPIWENVDRQFITTEKMASLFPYDDFDIRNKPKERPSKVLWEGKKLILGKSSLFPGNSPQWPAGEYLLEMKATDAYGKEVTHSQRFILFDKKRTALPVREFAWAHLSHKTAQPGDTVYFYIGSAEVANRVLIEIRSSAKVYYSKWVNISNKLKAIPLPITEEMRGKLSFEAVFIRHNIPNAISRVLDIPFTNKNLLVKLETQRDKLSPGSEESWTISVKDFSGKGKQAEVLAAMYDASLDVFKTHTWSFNVLPWAASPRLWLTDNGYGLNFSSMLTSYPLADYSYSWPPLPEINWYGLNITRFGYGRPVPMMTKNTSADDMAERSVLRESLNESPDSDLSSDSKTTAPAAVLSYLREDFRETAFFFPQLQTDSLGYLKFGFRLPDALTRWKLLLLAHNNELQSGTSEIEMTASKTLMTVPNLPRFFRQGDTAFIVTKIVNNGDEALSGIARLKLSDANTGKPLTTAQTNDKAFLKLKGGESVLLQWPVIIDNSCSLMAVHISTTAGTFTDGELNYIPVLPSGINVMESQALIIPANSTKTIEVKGLDDSANQMLRLDITPNPAWHAVQALPWLGQKGYENSDQLFYRFYANTLAAHIAAQIPETIKVINSWKNHQPAALLSKLEKDENLKSALLSETPWVFAAADESRQQQQIAMLFDLNRMQYEKEQMLEKLLQQQLPDGSWGWFPGMPGNRSISMQIVGGLGKLARLGAIEPNQSRLSPMIEKAMRYLDQEVLLDYNRMATKNSLKSYQMNHFHLQYLYARSLLSGFGLRPAEANVWEFLMNHAGTDWKKADIQNQALTALVLLQNEKRDLARQILHSLKEKSLFDPLQGRWWKTELHASNGHNLIETQAMLIEAYALSGDDETFCDGLRQWLLSHKQTNRWETSRATAEAVYALLLTGANQLEGRQAVKLSLNGKSIPTAEAEAGTAFFVKQWTGSEISSSLSPIILENPNQTMAWGSIFRQFSVPIDKVKPSTSQMSVERRLFVERPGHHASVLIPVEEDQIHIGDRIRVRLIIETDREMEFMHLKDIRSAAFEPVETLSGYKHSAESTYYQAINDVSTDFFFHYLPKGKLVIEYTLIATREGNFATGYASFQSFYAPAFSAHSQGGRSVVHP